MTSLAVKVHEILRNEHKQHHIEVKLCIYPSIPSLCLTQKIHNVISQHEDISTNHSEKLYGGEYLTRFLNGWLDLRSANQVNISDFVKNK